MAQLVFRPGVAKVRFVAEVINVLEFGLEVELIKQAARCCNLPCDSPRRG